jgi:phage head maturation protease
MKTDEILSLIDAEISKLKQARALLAEVTPVKGPAAKDAKVTAKAPGKRRKMSAETRAKMAAAQKKRWAAIFKKKA